MIDQLENKLQSFSWENIMRYKNEMKEISKMRPPQMGLDTAFTPNYKENVHPNQLKWRHIDMENQENYR